METLLYNISQVLGITILHSLWQGLLIYAVIQLLLAGFPATSAVKKYNLLYTGLMAMAVWFAYTFFMEAKLYNWTANAPTHFALPTDATLYNSNETRPAIPSDQPFYYNYKQFIKSYLPYVSVLYLISVVINLVRLATGWQSIRKIRKQSTAAQEWQPLTDKLAKRAGVFKHVQISFSNLIDVPCAFGYIKPILLLPVSISTQLSAEEIEVIILHELAHIKNNDYILNLIQQIVALLLFLNPFAQLVSKMIDLERENRCDDTVLQIGDPLTYAGALVKLEKTRQQNLKLALAATGKKYHLFARIQRIMGGDKPAVNIKHLVFGMLIFIGSLGSIAWLNPEIKDGRISSKNGEAAVQQLAKIVKEVITPDAQKRTLPNAGINKIADVPVRDKAATAADSINLKRVERETLVAEYLKLSRALNEYRDKENQLPEQQQLVAAFKAMTSVKINEDELPPELKQEINDMQSARNEYFQSTLYKNRKAAHDRFVYARYEAVKRQPEMAAFLSEYDKQKDSVAKSIMEVNGLSREELQKNSEWRNWMRDADNKRSALELKLWTVPEIKALDDSIDYTTNLIYKSPEFEEYQKKAKASKAYLDFTSRLSEASRKAYKEAQIKLYNTPEWKRADKDRKRFSEIVEKLKQ